MKESSPIPAALVLTQQSIAEFVQAQSEAGASADCLRQRKGQVTALYRWLPEDKTITKEALIQWRQDMENRGLSPSTILNHVKAVNRYLDFMGRPELRFNRGKPKDLTGQQFGYLTALEPTGGRNRRDILWRCTCQCGREIEITATRLLTGNTLSCGCLKAEHLSRTNQYYANTSLRQSMEEKVESNFAASGYTGVTMKRGKWLAYIKYQGRQYELGSFDNIEDAVKARARAKEQIREDAAQLLAEYAQLHQDALPRRQHKKHGAE